MVKVILLGRATDIHTADQICGCVGVTFRYIMYNMYTRT